MDYMSKLRDVTMASFSKNSDEGNGTRCPSNSSGMNVHGDSACGTSSVGHEAHGNGNGSYNGNHNGNYKPRETHATSSKPRRNSPAHKNRLLNYQVHHQFDYLKSNSNSNSNSNASSPPTVGNGISETNGNHNHDNNSHNNQSSKSTGTNNEGVNHRSRVILGGCNSAQVGHQAAHQSGNGNQPQMQESKMPKLLKPSNQTFNHNLKWGTPAFNIPGAKLPDYMELKTNHRQLKDDRVSKQSKQSKKPLNLQPQKPVSEIKIDKIVSSFKDQNLNSHANIICTQNGSEIETVIPPIHNDNVNNVSANKSIESINPTQAKDSCINQLASLPTSTTCKEHTDININNHDTIFSPISVALQHDGQQQQQESIINDNTDISTENATIIMPTQASTTAKKKNKRRISFDEQNIVNTSLHSREMNRIVDHRDDDSNGSNNDGVLPLHPQSQNQKQQHDSSISDVNNTPDLKITDLFVPDLTTTDLLHISKNEVTFKSLSHQLENDDEESSSINSVEDAPLCLPMPSFMQRLLSSKQKRRKLNSIEDVAKKLSVEYENKREKIRNDCLLCRDEERIKNIWIGDYGLTLFLPFDVDTFEYKANIDLVEEASTNDHDGDLDSDLSLSDNETNCSDGAFSECSFNDEVIIDVEHDVEEIPNILSIDQMKEINRRGLPASVQLMTWKRAYSLRRDGDYFGTMFDKCCFFKHTLIVIKTIEGDIIGGYADTPWVEQKKSGGLQHSHSMTFFGSGRTFLFATNPDLTDEERAKELKARSSSRDKMHFYPWSGENDYNQIIDNERGLIGMGGGGGEFGFFIQRDFTVGSTGRSKTFLNPPLVKSDGGNFKILDLEVYGFSSMLERMSPNPTRSSMSYSSFGSIGKLSRNSSHGSFARQSSFSSSVTSMTSFLT